MGQVFNSGNGGLICDCCRSLIAVGTSKIKLMVDQIYFRKTKKGSTQTFCSILCFNKNCGQDVTPSVLKSEPGESITNPFN